jgi:hypothetical protein
VAAAISDGVLTIRLARPINTTIDAFTESLGSYVSTGRRDEDGLTYRFALQDPSVAIHSSTQANITAVDLVPDSFKGVPPELPRPPPPPRKDVPDVSKLPVIKVRVAEYSNFTRIVFDWPMPVLYTPYPGQGRISVRFEALARPDFSMLESRSPAWIKNAGWHIDGAATVVEFGTDAESTFHDSRDGAKVNLDVLAPKTDASAYAPPKIDDGMRGGVLITPPPGPPPKGSDAAAVVAQKPAAAEPVPAAPAPAATPVKNTSVVAGPSAELTRDGMALHFPAARGHAVAVFTRGDTLWIVLDGHPPVDGATLLAPVTNLITKASAGLEAGAAVIKLSFRSPLLPSITENESALHFNLSSAAASPPGALGFTRQGADGQTTLTTLLPGANRVLELNDADAGDRLFVVPARPGKGVLTAKRFAELLALPSSAGLAVIPFTDDLAALVQNELVTFSRPSGLALSAASGANSTPTVQVEVSRQGPAYVDFANWGKGDVDSVYGAERNLRAAVARLPESEGNAARLRLARFLLANNLAPEALGEIQLIQTVDPKLAGDTALTGMKGVAQFMMGRYADARMSLSASALGNDLHATLWRGLAENRLGDFANARHDLALSQSVLHLYPESWQVRARLARAETGLSQGDLASASDALDQISPDLSPRDSVEARLYAAELHAAQGHVNEAISRLRALEKTDYLPVATQATFARVNTELAAKKIKPTDAIETLERLRYRWRGDDLELKILRRLGSLYFDEKRWREGLDVLRVAALHFPNAELAREAQDDMRRAFNDLFLGGKVDDMRPVDALALFYDFIELTPIGRDGDEMIRRLSDRLVAVDLLGPAEQLLEHQVKQRLDGVARASVATKLAMIYLMDRKPKEALATINDTRQTRLPDDINEQRRLLESRALAGLNQYDAAVDLVADDDTTEARRLRADIYWEAGNWLAAGTKTEELLGDRWNVSGPLNEAERAEIMRAAVSYSLAGDEAKLQKLREHYEGKMNASPDAKGFAMVTERIDRQGVAFRDLVKQLAAVDTLQAFMADFKKQGTAAKTAGN